MPYRTIAVLVVAGVLAGWAQTARTDRADLLDCPIDCAVADVDIAAVDAANPGAAEGGQ